MATAFPPTLPATLSDAVRATHLCRSFELTRAVNDVSFSIHQGEIFAVVGPDGAGKTTLVRLLCGVIAPTSGDCLTANVSVVAEPDEVKSRIGYMPQRFSLYVDLTTMENLRFYSELYGVPRKLFEERATRLLSEFEIDEFRDRLAGMLSGGMKQKLALACTLIHEPDLLLLDEPTAGVDPVSRRRFWRLLYGLNARGKTIYVNTPYMDEADHAGRVALMYGGSFIACDTPRHLKDNIQGEVVEITAADTGAARHALRDLQLILSLELFGSRLHALVPSAANAIPTITTCLAEHHVGRSTVRRVFPSLEDAFVAVVGSRERNL
jgi:ABC-2 type transport system ATP-binding protein